MTSVHMVGIPAEIRNENLWDLQPYWYRFWLGSFFLGGGDAGGGRLRFLLEASKLPSFFRRPNALSTGELGLQSTVQKLTGIRVL